MNVVLLRRKDDGTFDVVADVEDIDGKAKTLNVATTKGCTLCKEDCGGFSLGMEVFERTAFRRRGLRVFVADGRKGNA